MKNVKIESMFRLEKNTNIYDICLEVSEELSCLRLYKNYSKLFQKTGQEIMNFNYKTVNFD